jgi:hypothetical protein
MVPDGKVEDHVSLALSRFVPMEIRRRGVELRRVLNSEQQNTQKADRALLKVIARARCWFDDLITGQVNSMAEIGSAKAFPKIT